jgi:hypothetical protein
MILSIGNRESQSWYRVIHAALHCMLIIFIPLMCVYERALRVEREINIHFLQLFNSLFVYNFILFFFIFLVLYFCARNSFVCKGLASIKSIACQFRIFFLYNATFLFPPMKHTRTYTRYFNSFILCILFLRRKYSFANVLNLSHMLNCKWSLSFFLYSPDMKWNKKSKITRRRRWASIKSRIFNFTLLLLFFFLAASFFYDHIFILYLALFFIY